MDNHTQEVMAILQEECAEVTQAVSKCFRFGLTNLKPGKPKTNQEHLQDEIGDLLAMVDILKDMNIVTEEGLNKAKQVKFEKLKKWSNIYEQN